MSDTLAPQKRILHVLTEASSPIADTAATIIAGQLERGYRVAVASRPEVFQGLSAQHSQLRHIEIPSGPGPFDLSTGRSAFRLHKNYRHIDIVHAHGRHAAVLAGLGLTGLPTRMHPPIIATIGRDEDDSVFGAQHSIVARTATAVLGTTERVVADYEDDVAVVQRAQLVRTDDDGFPRPSVSAEKMRRRLSADDGRMVIAVPIEAKDTAELTEVVEAVVALGKTQSDRRWRVVFTGRGRVRSHLEKLSHALDYVTVAAPSDAVNIVNAADIVITSARMTGLDSDDVMNVGRATIVVGNERLARAYGPQAAVANTAEEIGRAIAAYAGSPAARISGGFALRERVRSGNRDHLTQTLLELYAYAENINA
ncbi:glycosyltransferase family 4 protein [Brevibacterium sp. HMSC07C04]|uniref:glycosyltransferase family 4 protein n=1 Tax=Brevibacterium sp. HMSC07C04 TaxID=1581130 RepID=UPI0008B908FB|nr:glycosyltransferase family 4 protein [Brevibacterium sp. HMSC07C04]OFS26792.1 hypothetical protein HMPREF3162_04520 [Brevibacterium sp. HMSC07C04]